MGIPFNHLVCEGIRVGQRFVGQGVVGVDLNDVPLFLTGLIENSTIL